MVNQLRSSVSQFKVSEQAEMVEAVCTTPHTEPVAENPPIVEKQERKTVHTMMMPEFDAEDLAEPERLPERTIDDDLLRQLQEASKLLDETPNNDAKSNPTRDSKNSPAMEQGNTRRAVPRTMTMDDE
jgi:hypothetical protein